MAQLSTTAGPAKLPPPGAWADSWGEQLVGAARDWESLDWVEQEVFDSQWFAIVEPWLERIRVGQESPGPEEMVAVRRLQRLRV